MGENTDMSVRTTVDIPEPLHDTFRVLSLTSGTTGRMVTGPMITGEGKVGPQFPVDENPYDLIFP